MKKEPLSGPVLLFDGICNLCSSIVTFVIQRDTKRRFLFASLQSESGQRLLRQFNLPTRDFNTFILVEGDRSYSKSSAALRVFKGLGGLLALTYALIFIPRPIRDFVYDWIARNRYAWFGKKEQCLMPTPEIKARFLE